MAFCLQPAQPLDNRRSNRRVDQP
ncbi:MAG: hypothetical protein QOF51_997, partial [Chloroflexota bacterium]|nr:hypothetical protein [Chloroflexota bacterium]